MNVISRLFARLIGIPICPHCGTKLGQHAYASNCPQCRKRLHGESEESPSPGKISQGPTPAEAKAASQPERSRNLDFESQIKKQFSVTLTESGFRCDCESGDWGTADVSDPDIVSRILDNLRSVLGIKRVLILAANQPVLVVDASPPISLKTSLGPAAVAALVAATVRRTGRNVVQYRSTLLLELE